jgi:serine/threonine protein kinase
MQASGTPKYSRVGNYNLLRTIGVGGSCKVKLGQHVLTGEKVAIKLLKKEKVEDYEKFSKYFINELKVMRKVDHSNILKLIDGSECAVLEKPNGTKKEVIYLALELAPNRELFDFVAHAGYLPESIARYYFNQILSAIQYLHSSGLTHRDMKPQNILFDENFNMKISDFGYATNIGGNYRHGFCMTKLGTAEYAAPEILA